MSARCHLRAPFLLAAAALMAIPFLMHAFPSLAQGQLVTEDNIRDGILERRSFLPLELDSLDINRDSRLDVADLVLFLIRSANLVPSVSFDSYSSTFSESAEAYSIELSLTKPAEQDLAVTYRVSGTARSGLKAEGGDYVVSGLNAATSEGVVEFPAGASRAAIVVQPQDDGLLEGTEAIHLTLTGGSASTYFLGALQSHIAYLRDNDAVWTVGLDLPDGAGYISFNLEVVQEDGIFSGRVLADGGVVPMPEEGDPSAAREDGWAATVTVSRNAMRIEAGPIPLDDSLTVLRTPYSRYFVLEAHPGKTAYHFDPLRSISGEAVHILEPVRYRLGPAWQERRYLRREARGQFTMVRHADTVQRQEVELVPAP